MYDLWKKSWKNPPFFDVPFFHIRFVFLHQAAIHFLKSQKPLVQRMGNPPSIWALDPTGWVLGTARHRRKTGVNWWSMKCWSGKISTYICIRFTIYLHMYIYIYYIYMLCVYNICKYSWFLIDFTFTFSFFHLPPLKSHSAELLSHFIFGLRFNDRQNMDPFLHLETWSLELQTIQIGRPVGHNWKSIERCLLSQEVGQNDVSEYVGNNLANRKVDSCSQEHPNVESFKLQMTKKALPSSKRAALEHPKTSSCLLPIATHVSVMMGHGSRIAWNWCLLHHARKWHQMVGLTLKIPPAFRQVKFKCS